MIFCVAPMITWALVFRDPPADSVTMQPISSTCFSEKLACESAAAAANYALKLAFSHHVAACEEQPAGDPTKPFRSIPFGLK